MAASTTSRSTSRRHARFLQGIEAKLRGRFRRARFLRTPFTLRVAAPVRISTALGKRGAVPAPALPAGRSAPAGSRPAFTAAQPRGVNLRGGTLTPVLELEG